MFFLIKNILLGLLLLIYHRRLYGESLLMIYILTIQKQQPDIECNQLQTLLSLTASFPDSAGSASLWDSL